MPDGIDDQCIGPIPLINMRILSGSLRREIFNVFKDKITNILHNILKPERDCKSNSEQIKLSSVF